MLNATDVANPLQEELEEGAALLATKWDALFYANQLNVEEFQTVGWRNTGVSQECGASTDGGHQGAVAGNHDGAGFSGSRNQVIKKVVALARDLESQLMGILIETIPGEKRTESVTSLLNGPVINAGGRSDVVVSQQQVDDLLDSLGF